ncbi:hypothetical protein QRO11_12135 [Paracidovorax citrulli]|uniref:hypothetical protein n=1 Tax=Paracidovorax citrulli TaxID=80869 RepID=UPI0005FAE014|nr:hypothetical protein [Paracidovorax citrulli]UMT88358.1 hypothetical protein FRC90_09940 [Paracidovorax citrulli]WIY32733.1 hypothetical protein QRO11_12135 [Paracidovorax citrulli]SDJ31917.1 hypothetical protein SAMN04489709_10392 [Paracidovorax citrulli]
MDEKEQHQILINEIRYAQRITQRTARLYRRVGTFLTFVGILGGSGMVASLSSKLPDGLVVAGGALLAVAGAAALAIRPLEKAIVNEQDLKKYTALESQAVAMDLSALKLALSKARETDVAEIELLRDVAYNDVVVESGRPDMRAPLNLPQKFIAALA